jgi:hypothetical protein
MSYEVCAHCIIELWLTSTCGAAPGVYSSIAITMMGCAENIVILLRYFGWWPYLF